MDEPRVQSSPLAAYPSPMKSLLLAGSVGREHLLRTARTGLALLGSVQGEELILLADGCRQILLEAHLSDPLGQEPAALLLEVDRAAPFLSREMKAGLTFCAAPGTPPANTGYLDRLTGSRDTAKLARYLEDMACRETDNLFWRRKGPALAAFTGDREMAHRLAGLPLPEAARPQALLLAARTALDRGDPQEGLALLDRAGEALGPDSLLQERGRTILQAGEPDEGTRLLLRAHAAQPWRTSALLRAHGIALGLDRECADLPGSTAVCLYTWNKAADLDETLEALETVLEGVPMEKAGLFVLDNGSTDETPGVLDKWQSRLGSERMARIDLRVNVGAPAARNWLMHDEGVSRYDHLLYLDDDALVPPDLLGRFGALVRRYPDAGVWGCKVADHAQPGRLQSVDLNLAFPEGADPETLGDDDLSRDEPSPFRLTNLHVQSMDQGWFDHMRPCASVTGCCHLFDRERLLKHGEFSLMLSPSQYDDMERDIRMCAAGGHAACTGFLTVLHKKSTGAASLVEDARGMRERGQALGNKFKMQAMHPVSEVRAAKDRLEGLLEEDLAAKARELDRA